MLEGAGGIGRVGAGCCLCSSAGRGGGSCGGGGGGKPVAGGPFWSWEFSFQGPNKRRVRPSQVWICAALALRTTTTGEEAEMGIGQGELGPSLMVFTGSRRLCSVEKEVLGKRDLASLRGRKISGWGRCIGWLEISWVRVWPKVRAASNSRHRERKAPGGARAGGRGDCGMTETRDQGPSQDWSGKSYSSSLRGECSTRHSSSRFRRRIKVGNGRSGTTF